MGFPEAYECVNIVMHIAELTELLISIETNVKQGLYIYNMDITLHFNPKLQLLIYYVLMLNSPCFGAVKLFL